MAKMMNGRTELRNNHERDFYDFLKKYLPDECIVYNSRDWHRDGSTTREIDFIVIIPDQGILIIDEKSWGFSFLYNKGVVKKALDQKEIHRKFFEAEFKKYIQNHIDTTIVAEDAYKKEKPICRYWPVIAFNYPRNKNDKETWITRENLEKKDGAYARLLPNDSVITVDEIESVKQGNVDLKELLVKKFFPLCAEKAFKGRMNDKQLEEFGCVIDMWRNYDASTEDDRKRAALRDNLFMDVNSRSGIDSYSLLMGDSLIELTNEVKAILAAYDDSAILLTCDSDTVSNMLKQALSNEQAKNPKLTIKTFTDFCLEDLQTRETPSKENGEQILDCAEESGWKYDVILVAEPEAFETSWLEALRLLKSPAPRPLVPTPKQRAVIEQLKNEDKENPIKGHRRLMAVAGGGKTVILANLAKYLSKARPKEQILLTCYNELLAQQLSDFLAKQKNVDVKTFYSLVEPYAQLEYDENGMPKDKELGEKALQKLKGFWNSFRAKKYDLILVDEGEDFYAARSWFHVLNELGKKRQEYKDASYFEKYDDMIIACDFNQNLPSGTSSRKQGVYLTGPRIERPQDRRLELNDNFRNTKQIAKLAAQFNTQTENSDNSEEKGDIKVQKVSRDTARGPEGYKPLLQVFSTTAELVDSIVSSIENGVFCDEKINENVPPEQVAILYQSQTDYVKEALSLIKTHLGENGIALQHISSQGRLSREEKEKLSEDGVKIMPISASKGLEFKVVIVLGADHMSEKRSLKYQNQQMLIAVTRATDYLVITDSGAPSALMDKIRDTPLVKIGNGKVRFLFGEK